MAKGRHGYGTPRGAPDSPVASPQGSPALAPMDGPPASPARRLPPPSPLRYTSASLTLTLTLLLTLALTLTLSSPNLNLALTLTLTRLPPPSPSPSLISGIANLGGPPARSKCSLASAPARLLRLLRARLEALGSSALLGRGRATGRPVSASGARASRLKSR